jgi:hypothetical protein
MMMIKNVNEEQINELKKMFKTEDESYAIKRAEEMMQIFREVFTPIVKTLKDFAYEMQEMVAEAINETSEEKNEELDKSLSEFKANNSVEELFSDDNQMQVCK